MVLCSHGLAERHRFPPPAGAPWRHGAVPLPLPPLTRLHPSLTRVSQMDGPGRGRRPGAAARRGVLYILVGALAVLAVLSLQRQASAVV